MRKLLIFLFFTFVSLEVNATTVQIAIDPTCQKELSVKCESLTNKDEISQIIKHHITFCLALRMDLIKESAVVSKEYVDLHLYITIIDYLNNNKLSNEEVAYFKGVEKILSSMPLQIEKLPSKRLKEKLLSLGGNGM